MPVSGVVDWGGDVDYYGEVGWHFGFGFGFLG